MDVEENAPISLTEEQQQVIDDVKDGHHVCGRIVH